MNNSDVSPGRESMDARIQRFAERLAEILPGKQWIRGDSIGPEYGEDTTEEVPRMPSFVVWPLTTEETAAVTTAAAEMKMPLTVRVSGTNVGGLAIPPSGGVVVDLSRMNKILEIQETEMYALVEPGVTWQQLRDRLDEENIPLRVGYPLSPPDSSIMANCLLDGLGGMSLLHGSMGDWIGGIEVVLPDGTIARLGAPALGDIWFGRSPLPGLVDLFVNWQSISGIVTKLAIQLWPKPPISRRFFVLFYERNGAFAVMRELAAMGIADDVGGLSWTTGKMLYGVEKPLTKGEDEPEFFLYLEITGHDPREIDIKTQLLDDILKRTAVRGFEYEKPFPVETLIELNPDFHKLADFPTRLDFLLDTPGGGLSWVGTYGPMSRFEAFADRALALMERYEVPPTVVSRPMKGGHFGVLRFISIFDKSSEQERKKIREMNTQIAKAAYELGFVVYKTPPWAVELAKPYLDPGYVKLFNKVRKVLDPAGIMAPHCWRLDQEPDEGQEG